MSAHTPAPWAVSRLASPEYAPEFGVFPDTPNGAACLARTMNADAEVNARLVAAAPELLEALRECASLVRDNYERLGYATQPACVTRAYAAINKATRETA